MALSQTAVAIVCHATRRVAQNQPEQMFERPHVIEDPVRCGFLRAIVKQFDGLVPFELSRRDDGNGDHGTNRLQRSDHKSLITFYQSPSFNPAHVRILPMLPEEMFVEQTIRNRGGRGI